MNIRLGTTLWSSTVDVVREVVVVVVVVAPGTTGSGIGVPAVFGPKSCRTLGLMKNLNKCKHILQNKSRGLDVCTVTKSKIL